MTYIELARDVRGKVGMQGTGPASVNASGAELDIVNSVRDAWIDIQNSRPNWRWMRTRVEFFTTASQTTYELSDIFVGANRFKYWRKDTIYVTIDGQKKPVRYLDYDTFVFKYNNETVPKAISEYTIRPEDDALIFNLPDAIYSIIIDYQKSPQILATDGEEPELPEYYHLLISYKATEKYCAVISAPEIYQQYSQDYARMWGEVTRTHLPKIVMKVRGIA